MQPAAAAGRAEGATAGEGAVAAGAAGEGGGAASVALLGSGGETSAGSLQMSAAVPQSSSSLHRGPSGLSPSSGAEALISGRHSELQEQRMVSFRTVWLAEHKVLVLLQLGSVSRNNQENVWKYKQGN